MKRYIKAATEPHYSPETEEFLTEIYSDRMKALKSNKYRHHSPHHSVIEDRTADQVARILNDLAQYRAQAQWDDPYSIEAAYVLDGILTALFLEIDYDAGLVPVLKSSVWDWSRGENLYTYILYPSTHWIDNENALKVMFKLIIDHQDSFTDDQLYELLSSQAAEKREAFIRELDGLDRSEWIAKYLTETGKDPGGRILRAIKYDEYKRPHKKSRSKASRRSHQDIVDAIDSYDGTVDVLYEETPEGEYIEDLMVPVQSELNVELIPSIQGGIGSMDIYDANTDELITSVDYSEFNDDVVNAFMTVDTDDEFKSDYKDMLRRIINK